jgi:hypothetical protein
VLEQAVVELRVQAQRPRLGSANEAVTVVGQTPSRGQFGEGVGREVAAEDRADVEPLDVRERTVT